MPRKKTLTPEEYAWRQAIAKRKTKLKKKIARAKKKPEKADAWSDPTFLSGVDEETEINRQILFEKTSPIAKMFASQFQPPKRKKKVKKNEEKCRRLKRVM